MDMYRMKKYAFAIGMMTIVALLSLLIVSVFTYLFKWQADKAMVGIIVTYVLSGFAGGVSLRVIERREYGKEDRGAMKQNAIETITSSGVFILVLLIFSIFVLQIPFEWTGRTFIILGLIIGSSFLGRIL